MLVHPFPHHTPKSADEVLRLLTLLVPQSANVMGRPAWKKAVRTALMVIQGAKCARCGWHFPSPLLLDHHHLDHTTKTATVGQLIQDRRSLQTIATEAALCATVCPTCHRIIHSFPQGGPTHD